MQTLILLSHPNMANSKVNKALKNAALECQNLNLSELYAKYPNEKIDVKAEQELLLNHEKIIFQFPVFWYATPPLLKKYFDEVFSYGFAYGEKARALKGKEFGFCLSFGDEEQSFEKEGKVGFSVDEIITPFKAMSKFVGAKYGGYFAVFDAHELSQNELLQKGEQYKRFLI